MLLSAKFEIIPGLEILVDIDDVNKIEAKKWRLIKRTSTGFYFLSTFRENGRACAISLPRHLMGLTSNDQSCVRFKSCDDPYDYRKSNFEICSRLEVSHRQRALKQNKSSRFRGVYLDHASRRWKAEIRFKGKRIFLGYFDSELDAAKAFNEAALLYFGQKAHQNKFS